MNAEQAMIYIALVLMAIALVFGFWLALSGKPYKNGVLTVHKLTALASVVLAVFFVIGLIRLDAVANAPVLLIVIAIVSVIALLASGGLLSAGSTDFAP
jgi:uncharacterized membrane protein